MELILPNDPRYFQLTSEGDYDRHRYKIVSKGGDAIIVDDWDSARSIWFSRAPLLSHIEVLDKKKEKKTKGFK